MIDPKQEVLQKAQEMNSEQSGTISLSNGTTASPEPLPKRDMTPCA